MRLSRRSQLHFLATATVILAIAATGWWISSSPLGIRRTAEAMAILVTGVCAFKQCGRLPKGTPLVLYTTLTGLVVTVLMFWR